MPVQTAKILGDYKIKSTATLFWPREQHGASKIRAIATGLERFIAIAVVVALAIATGIWNTDAHDDTQHARDKAHAEQDAASTAAPPTREYMVALYGGAPYTYDSDVSVKKPGTNDFTAHDVSWRGEPFNDPFYYGVRVQRWFEGGRTGAMLDFTHSKTLAMLQKEVGLSGLLNGAPAPERARLEDVFRRLEFSHGHNMLTLNGLVRLADLHPRLSPYIGLGVGANLPHSEIQLKKATTRTYEYQYTGPVAQVLIGLEFRIPRMSYFFEYKFTFASQHVPLSGLDGTKIGLFADLFRQASNWWSGNDPPDGYASTRLISHQLIGGLGVRFASHPAPVP